jgi:hypothetical protein
MYPQLVKMIAHGQEHIGYKGGQLQPAYKGRGPMDSCQSYRSLLISSHLGKVLHRTIHAKAVPAVREVHAAGADRRPPQRSSLRCIN